MPGTISKNCPLHPINAMSTKTTSPRKPLPLRGLETLAPEFSNVQEGKEFTPVGSVEALWRKSQPPCVTNWALLNYVAERLLPRSIPAGCDIAHGDANIFQLPPVADSEHASGSSTACLLLSAAKESGYYCLGRYRQILLGHTERGQRVVIYVHRLICWIVNGPVIEEVRKRRVTCHNVSGCPPSGACCNPLHLRCEFTSSQTVLHSTNQPPMTITLSQVLTSPLCRSDSPRTPRIGRIGAIGGNRIVQSACRI